MDQPLPRVHAVIQAGGKGTRLLPATAEVPKPMLEVGGEPMVERLLRAVIRSGVDRVTIVTGHLGEVVRRHVGGLRDLAGAARIDFLEEGAPIGNVGALGLLEAEGPIVLFAFGDLVTDLDFGEMVARHGRSGADVLLASHHEAHRLQLGELAVEGERVVGYREKPEKRFLICSGVGVFRREVLAVVPTDGTPTGIADLITRALAGGFTVAHWEHGAFWMDVNSPEALGEARRRLAGGA
jgi:NDP-sugar pyrophosphorylase family protein